MSTKSLLYFLSRKGKRLSESIFGQQKIITLLKILVYEEGNQKNTNSRYYQNQEKYGAN